MSIFSSLIVSGGVKNLVVLENEIRADNAICVVANIEQSTLYVTQFGVSMGCCVSILEGGEPVFYGVTGNNIESITYKEIHATLNDFVYFRGCRLYACESILFTESNILINNMNYEEIILSRARLQANHINKLLAKDRLEVSTLEWDDEFYLKFNLRPEDSLKLSSMIVSSHSSIEFLAPKIFDSQNKKLTVDIRRNSVIKAPENWKVQVNPKTLEEQEDIDWSILPQNKNNIVADSTSKLLFSRQERPLLVYSMARKDLKRKRIVQNGSIQTKNIPLDDSTMQKPLLSYVFTPGNKLHFNF